MRRTEIEREGQEADRRRHFEGRGDRCKNLVKKRLPIFSWLPKYDSEKFISDAIAGVTVGLTVMPQGLAYAILAGLEPQVRLVDQLFIFISIFFCWYCMSWLTRNDFHI